MFRPFTLALVFAASLLATTLLLGEDVLIVSKAGYFVLQQDSTGAPVLKPITKVVVLDDGPTPPPPPPGPVLTERAKAIRDAVPKSVDPNIAHALGLLHRELAKKVRAGELKGKDNIAMAVRAATDLVLLEFKADATLWQPPRAKLSEYFVKLVQEGGNDAAYAALLDDAAAGYSSAFPQAGAIDLAKLLDLILKILAIVMELFPKGVPR